MAPVAVTPGLLDSHPTFSSSAILHADGVANVNPAKTSGPLSFGDLYDLATGAGLDPASAAIAAAVALAESSGRPDAYNGVGGDRSYGLWQINMIGNLGPARRAQLGITSNDQLYDPATNARAMALISGGGSNFGPWTTFTSGAYRQYLTDPPAGGSTAGTGSGSSSGGSNTPVGLFDHGLVGALWQALGFDSDSSPSVDPSGDSGGPLSLDTFKLAARDAIQLALGGLLIWFGVESLLVSLTGQTIGKHGARVFGNMARRPSQVPTGWTPANRRAETERREIESRTPDQRAEIRRRARAARAPRTVPTGYSPPARRKGRQGLTERPAPSGRSTLITREDPF